MSRKLFVRLDRPSLKQDDLQRIVSSQQWSPLDPSESLFTSSFDDIVIDHAVLLMSGNHDRFGHDIRHYLKSASGFFEDVPSGLVVMPNGSVEFKKRYAEDLAVAISSLFMVRHFGVQWDTITQIPTKKSLKGLEKIPDFIGYDSSNRQRVYESKGTTRPDSVDKTRRKAKAQLQSFCEEVASKMAFVFFVPTDTFFPPILFVSDPPMKVRDVNPGLCIGLHFLRVCNFSGLNETTLALRDLLEQRLYIGQAIMDQSQSNWKQSSKYRIAVEKLKDAFENEAKTVEKESLYESDHVGVWRKGEKAAVFTGVRISRVEQIIAMLSSPPKEDEPQRPRVIDPIENKFTTSTSQFSDGTVLMIETGNRQGPTTTA